ncbi:hypothetical protein IF2G_02509 [Cordyceps javanica]|nr:hypothetical protein IF2G_02509 [Cordyceps javanica]
MYCLAGPPRAGPPLTPQPRRSSRPGPTSTANTNIAFTLVLFWLQFPSILICIVADAWQKRKVTSRGRNIDCYAPKMANRGRLGNYNGSQDFTVPMRRDRTPACSFRAAHLSETAQNPLSDPGVEVQVATCLIWESMGQLGTVLWNSK